MNLREAYFYINENKLRDFIQKRCNRVTSIKFMLEDVVYCEVLSSNPYCIDVLFGSIKAEIISRYITNEISLKDNHFYFRITDIEKANIKVYYSHLSVSGVAWYEIELAEEEE